MLLVEVPSAYAHLSSRLLRRTCLLFSLLSKGWIRRYVLPYLRPSWGKWPLIEPYLRQSLLGYFCGAESREGCTKAIHRLHKQGIYSVLDYAAEGTSDEASRKAHTKEAQHAIQQAATEEAIAFTAIKPSALGDMSIATQLTKGLSLTEEEQLHLTTFEQKLDHLCQEAHQGHLPLLIDAEEYAYRDYLDRLLMRLAARYNRSWPCVYHTFQLYLTDGYDRLQEMQAQAQREGFFLGVKLVRGAYMEKERALAKEKGYPSPIHDTKSACDRDYNLAICGVLDQIDQTGLYLGTHNEASCQLLIKEMKKRGIPMDHPHICVSQLYGMSEALSYGLLSMGLRVAKYIPYGPYDQLLPYLHRRLLENSSIKGQSSREQQAIAQELLRRKQNP